jgi:hypothetical protein
MEMRKETLKLLATKKVGWSMNFRAARESL